MTAWLLVPVALEMVNEKLTGRDLFRTLSGLPDAVEAREGKWRANGPFAHSILAGTVGALCLPLMIGIWRRHPRTAKIGLAACLTMVVTSSSSGPLMTLAADVLALGLWRWRHLTRQMRIAAVVGYLLLDLVMKSPPYFLMERIDLVGGSTGWYRAQLIKSAIAHLNEWWFAGTDYTRHWMDTGLIINDTDCDIVNYYIFQGVTGGLLLMGITIAFYWTGCRYAGRALQLRAGAPFDDRFLIWALGWQSICQRRDLHFCLLFRPVRYVSLFEPRGHRLYLCPCPGGSAWRHVAQFHPERARTRRKPGARPALAAGWRPCVLRRRSRCSRGMTSFCSLAPDASNCPGGGASVGKPSALGTGGVCRWGFPVAPASTGTNIAWQTDLSARNLSRKMTTICGIT